MLKGYSVSNNCYNALNFKAGKSKTKNPPVVEPVLSPADEFIQAVEDSERASLNDQKYFWSRTASLVTFEPLILYTFFSIVKLKKFNKMGNVELTKAFAKKNIKQLVLLYIAATLSSLGLEYLFSRNFDKKYKKFCKEFEDINTDTEAKLNNKIIRSSYIGAMCSPMSEEITFNTNLILDPIMRRRAKKMIKHELVHAKQYETIARSEDGIKKLNYAVLRSDAQRVDNPEGILAIEKVYQDIMSDKSGKYDNMIIHFVGGDINYKKYIVGIRTILNNKDAGYNDVPIIIDEAHYQKVIDKKGKLTPAETDKAEKYFKAMCESPTPTALNVLNPFSAYYEDLLEKEAYKENPNLQTFIRKLLGKDLV